jgi:hypothetical protein
MVNVLGGSASQTTDSPDEATLERARSMATLLDESIRIPVIGYRIGLDPLLGIAPVSGDVAAAVVSLYIVYAGAQAGVPKRKLVWMLGRIGVDLAVGSIPVVGTLVDAVWKNNKRNVAVIESHVESA